MKTLSERLIPYRTFLSAQKQQMEAEICELKQQNRQDEADLTRIRLNIFGVFETVAQADEKQSVSWEDFCRRYEPRFDTLTAPWRTKLASAEINNDSLARFVEEAKLSAAKQIHSAFIAAKE